MRKLLLLLPCVVLTGCPKRDSAVPALSPIASITPAKAQKVVLLMGQSNMSGWGNRAGPFDSRLSFVGTMQGVGIVGNGPGVSFATALFQHEPQTNVVLVQCALGGSPIDRWIPSGDLYQACVAMAPKVDIALFSQGEADAQLGNTGWDMKFTQLVSGLRQHYNNPSLPVIYTALGSNDAGLAGWDTVKQEQESLSIPHTALVTTDGLAKVDSLHYTLASYEQIGSRMAQQYEGLEQ